MKMKGTCMWIGVTVLAVAVGLLAIPASHAQRAAGVSRVGWLEACDPGPQRPNFDIFRRRLAELGYVEGKNLVVEQRFADCRYDRVSGLAAELVRRPLTTVDLVKARETQGTPCSDSPD